MTRKSRRELERAVDDLDTTNSETAYSRPDAIIWEDSETGEWHATPDMDGDPLEPDEVDPLMVIQETVVETSWERGSGR